MSTKELSCKLKYILTELGVNKQEFLKLCQQYSPSISKPTVLNAINGKNNTMPTIETLSTFIKVCQNSGDEKLKGVSYDFLLGDDTTKIEEANAQKYQTIGLSDEVIERLKQYSHPYFNHGNIINYYLTHTPGHFWGYLDMLKLCNEINENLKKLVKEFNMTYLKEISKLMSDERLQEYVKRNFKNVYDSYIKINNAQTDLKIYDLKEFANQMELLIEHFKYKLEKLNRDFLDNI